MIQYENMSKNKKFIAGGVIVGLILLIWLFNSGHSFTIGGNQAEITKTPSSIAGLHCDTSQRRPVAVMLGSDSEARPLSGVGQADVVIEMPVTPDGVTRFMTIFQCQTPKEIGSIRSAREDFIPLAAGFESIYAHWGGEHGALENLNQGIMDNVDALQFDGTVFYRKPGIKSPHNGFSTLNLLFQQAKTFGYSLTKDFVGYPHSDTMPAKNISNIATSMVVNYPSLNNVVWTYKVDQNIYTRNRGGSPEIDKNTGTQVTASVIAVMHTTSRVLVEGDQYITVKTTGQGIADIYQNGIRISGTWKKDPSRLDSKLYFYDQNNKEIQFVPGQLWIEIQTS